MTEEIRTALVAIAAFFEGGGSHRAVLHETPSSWAASEVRKILSGEVSLDDLIRDESVAAAVGEGWS